MFKMSLTDKLSKFANKNKKCLVLFRSISDQLKHKNDKSVILLFVFEVRSVYDDMNENEICNFVETWNINIFWKISFVIYKYNWKNFVVEIMSTKDHNLKLCCFCGLTEDNELEFGKFHEHHGIVTHYYCLLLSSNMEQKGNDNEGILGFLVEDIQKELRRGKRLICSYCKKNGATLGCCNTRCKRIFHFPCGLRAGTLHQFFGEFRSYCVKHRPKQKIDELKKNAIKENTDTLCYICYDNVNPKNFIGTLWAPCCKKDAWFHRKCVQQLAMNAGYFFKCPLCNNKKEFQKAMLQYGIFIPSQDASWELEPNAFQELLYRHDRCDAVTCLCPKGRNYTSMNAKWELALCRTCGSQGIHMACGQLKWANPVWSCDECISILDKVKQSTKNVSETINITYRNIDTDTSDSEISVGGTQDKDDLPMLSYSHTCPASRSFKLTSNEILTNTACENNCSSSSQNVLTTSSVNFQEKSTNAVAFSLSEDKNVPQTNQEKSVLQTDQENSLLKTDQEKSVLQTDEKENVLKTGQQKNILETVQEKNVLQTNQRKSVLETNQEKTTEDKNFQSLQLSISSSNIDLILIDSDEDDIEIINTSKRSNIGDQTLKKMTLTNCDTKTKINNLDQSIDISFIQSEMARKRNNEIEEERKISGNENHKNFDNSSVMNIKITNVTSVSPEVFASVSDLKSSGNHKLLELNTSPSMNFSNSKDFQTKNARLSSSKCQCNEVGINSKRKHETNICVIGTHTNGIKTVVIDKSKKVKGNDVEENMKASCSATSYNEAKLQNDNLINIKSSHKSVKDRSTYTNQQVFESSNYRKNKISYKSSTTNIFPSMLQLKNHNIAENQINNTSSLISDQSTSKDEFVTHVRDSNTYQSLNTEKNFSSRKMMSSQNSDSLGIKDGIRSILKQCDGNAGTSFASESTDDHTRTKDDRIHPKGASVKRKWTNLLQSTDFRGNGSDDHIQSNGCSVFSEIASNPNACDRPRLIPESVQLQDLKFKVCDSNNVQMILYDTFSVNIKMNTATKNHVKDSSTSVGVSNMRNSLLELDDESTIATCSRPSNLYNPHLISDKDKSTSDTIVSKNIINQRDNVKENFNPIMQTFFANISNNFSIVNTFNDKYQSMST
ncbi:signal transducer and activator of transcription B-like isoform X1 [Vespula squamosa]|uniref:Signal transducer and activator of transcription B-like isoform X1 n=1 Tax=Vespula squamosa TaxID=30214 RepID=A0ABD2APP3_VESSQ